MGAGAEAKAVTSERRERRRESRQMSPKAMSKVTFVQPNLVHTGTWYQTSTLWLYSLLWGILFRYVSGTALREYIQLHIWDKGLRRRGLKLERYRKLLCPRRLRSLLPLRQQIFNFCESPTRLLGVDSRANTIATRYARVRTPHERKTNGIPAHIHIYPDAVHCRGQLPNLLFDRR